MTFAEFIALEVKRGKLRLATKEELQDRPCSDFWHHPFMDGKRCGTCPNCGQRLKGWYYEA